MIRPAKKYLSSYVTETTHEKLHFARKGSGGGVFLQSKVYLMISTSKHTKKSLTGLCQFDKFVKCMNRFPLI